MGDFKLINDELYDVRRDPYEKEDLAARHADRVRAMKARLDALRASGVSRKRTGGSGLAVAGPRRGGEPTAIARVAEEAGR
ncbi:MAG: hypothetical protein WKF75_03635 [Singulisphaera sp.]